MLLMFGVGLHLSMDDLLSVRRIAVPGAIVQIAAATAARARRVAIALGLDSGGEALVFGLVPVVREHRRAAARARGPRRARVGQRADRRRLARRRGPRDGPRPRPAARRSRARWAASRYRPAPPRIRSLCAALGITLAKVAAFVVLMLVVGRRVFPRLLWLVAKTGSRELFTLCVIATAVGVAYGSAKLFDVSFALGAFFAGMMMRESEFSHRAADESLPLRDAFSVLFFVSVGMLFDPQVLVEQPAEARSRSSRSSWSARRSPPSRSCSPSATRSTPRSRWARASRRSASSPSSSRASAWRSGLLPAGGPEPHPRRRAHLDRAQSGGVRRDRAGAAPGSARARASRGDWSCATTRSRSCRCRCRSRSSPGRSCWSATAASAGASPRRWPERASTSSSPSRTARRSSSCARSGVHAVSATRPTPPS